LGIVKIRKTEGGVEFACGVEVVTSIQIGKFFLKMAASSSSTPLFGIREEDQNQMKQQHSSTPMSSTAPAPAPPPQKKKRNQPGTPCKYPIIFVSKSYHFKQNSSEFSNSQR
jgi:hypothetical protein